MTTEVLVPFGIPKRDPGWVYALCSGRYVKIGRTATPELRLKVAKTWCPEGIQEMLVKPFWNVRRLEYSLHAALAEYWLRGEWHEFSSQRWRDFFLDAFREFKDPETARDANSIDFAYWMNGTNYAECVGLQCASRLTLPKWRACHGDPWKVIPGFRWP